MALPDAALLLLGHGSTLNADSSAPTYQHAEEIRNRGIFAEVHVGFWKEEPNFRQALRQTHRRQVYVVPNFISSGYFTEQIIPRELGLTGPVTQLGGQDIYYCEPVGLHPDMTEALLRRARHVVAASGETNLDPAQTCLFICGHGTSLNDNSTKIIHDQAAVIRDLGIYADCQPVLMEQSPFVKDWRTLTSCPDVIVVPFFISDGLHSFEDIPVLLGLTHNIREQGFTNPHREDNRRLWYGTPIGTEDFVADVILAQVNQFQCAHPETRNPGGDQFEGSDIANKLIELMQVSLPPWRLGEIIIRPTDHNSYHVLHRDDFNRDAASLRILASPQDLRDMILLDRNGNFRPLRAAPNLRNGWLLHVPTLYGLQLALDYIYPATLANWTLWRQSTLATTPWSETAERQTGRFRIVRELAEPTLHELVANVCQSGCLKQRLWSPAAQPVDAPLNQVPLFCPEACNFLVSQAREKLKGPESMEGQPPA
jgi:sirohydrochlorin cobaltochelatase